MSASRMVKLEQLYLDFEYTCKQSHPLTDKVKPTLTAAEDIIQRRLSDVRQQFVEEARLEG